MLTAAEFSQLAALTGEPVTFAQVKPPKAQVAISRAIVQDLSRAPEIIVNTYGPNGKSIQIAAADLGGTVPEKFDVITRANGERYVIDLVNQEHARVTGAVTYYVAYCKGK